VATFTLNELFSSIMSHILSASRGGDLAIGDFLLHSPEWKPSIQEKGYDDAQPTPEPLLASVFVSPLEQEDVKEEEQEEEEVQEEQKDVKEEDVKEEQEDGGVKEEDDEEEEEEVEMNEVEMNEEEVEEEVSQPQQDQEDQSIPLDPDDIVISDENHPGTIAFRVFVNNVVQTRLQDHMWLSIPKFSPIVYASIMDEWRLEQQNEGRGKHQPQPLPNFFIVEPHWDSDNDAFLSTLASMKQRIDFVRTCYLAYEEQQ
jgi:hypothetical protein